MSKFSQNMKTCAAAFHVNDEILKVCFACFFFFLFFFNFLFVWALFASKHGSMVDLFFLGQKAKKLHKYAQAWSQYVRLSNSLPYEFFY